MKKNYISPEYLVISLNMADIITESPIVGPEGPSEEDNLA